MIFSPIQFGFQWQLKWRRVRKSFRAFFNPPYPLISPKERTNTRKVSYRTKSNAESCFFKIERQRQRERASEKKNKRFLIFGLIWDKWSLHLNGQHTEASTILNIKRGYLGKQRTDRRIIYVRHLVFYVRAPNGNFPIESFAQIRFIYFCFSILSFALSHFFFAFIFRLFLAFRSFFAAKKEKKKLV